jgi:hypothetical protein
MVEVTVDLKDIDWHSFDRICAFCHTELLRLRSRLWEEVHA